MFFFFLIFQSTSKLNWRKNNLVISLWTRERKDYLAHKSVRGYDKWTIQGLSKFLLWGQSSFIVEFFYFLCVCMHVWCVCVLGWGDSKKNTTTIYDFWTRARRFVHSPNGNSKDLFWRSSKYYSIFFLFFKKFPYRECLGRGECDKHQSREILLCM